MILYDTHTHSNFSTDSKAKIGIMLDCAKKAGLKGIIITDHMDYDFPEDFLDNDYINENGLPPFTFDVNKYFDEINKLKSKDFDLLIGVELGLKNTDLVVDKNKKLLDCYNFDYVIGSTHIVDNYDPYYRSFWDGKDEKQCIHRYYEQILDSLNMFYDIDSLGHLDYITRYAPNEYKYNPEDFDYITSKIFDFILDKNIALEINTANLGKNNMQNPHDYMIQKYYDMGGRLITIGSDAHKENDIALKFDYITKKLKGFGFTQYAVFTNRIPKQFDL